MELAEESANDTREVRVVASAVSVKRTIAAEVGVGEQIDEIRR